ncbi:efflux RND transporter periplasmic adaptor subunit [Thiohalobacter thiocyanaticus]|uniref:efflux RND transporter periplasmic adaptor subunit n=1 Tax=Thiohalobacter thiocyanaticus TaxID=585455 RepID=UPI000BBB05A0|nr:efflux RND transporter periplasmic adaptor subunit [Thiohalobacter thiocyanaticus]
MYPTSLLCAGRLHTLLGLLLLPVLATAQERLARVGTGAVERAPIIEEVPLTGTLTSPRVAQVSTSVAGLVEAINVDVGDRVEAGDPLVRLDRELEQLALASARAATRRARAELADTRRRLEEARQLRARQSFPETEVRTLEAQVGMQEAEVERLAAEAQRREARLRRHVLNAPFAGVINRKLTEAGEWVEPGTAVVELIAVDNLRLDLRVPQRYFPRIDADTRLQVRLDAAPERELAARIGTVVPVNDPSARTFLLRAWLDAPDIPLTPGMSARAVLQLDTGQRGLVVPRDALLRYPDGRVSVWVVEDAGEDGTASVTEHNVETGLAFDGRIEIRSGLEPGLRVVTTGNESLQPDQRVRPVGAD